MTLNVEKLYADLHPLAEVGGTEKNTSAYVAKTLQSLGIECKTGVGRTGVVGWIRSGQPGPVVLARADMDALPFSTEDGGTCAIHACGHDAHTSMLLAAAERMIGKVKRGTLKLVFQPAEEIRSGALWMIEDGVLDDVDIAVGAHIRPEQDMPAGGFCSSLNHVASATVRVRFIGKVAHGARPHLGVNPIDEAMSFIAMVNCEHYDPAKSWTVKATRIRTEEGAVNSLAAWCEVMFDLRAQNNEIFYRMLENMERQAKAVAAGFGGEVEFQNVDYCPAPEYDRDLMALIDEAIVETVGKSRLFGSCGGGGEDFHFYKERKPSIKSAYFGVGVGAAPGLHHRQMHFDPKYLQDGVAVWERVLVKLLG